MRAVLFAGTRRVLNASSRLGTRCRARSALGTPSAQALCRWFGLP